jgi:hypothetical protein
VALPEIINLMRMFLVVGALRATKNCAVSPKVSVACGSTAEIEILGFLTVAPPPLAPDRLILKIYPYT